jgi:hypothetical protein
VSHQSLDIATDQSSYSSPTSLSLWFFFVGTGGTVAPIPAHLWLLAGGNGEISFELDFVVGKPSSTFTLDVAQAWLAV